MKKKVLTAAVAAMITLTTGVVMANPVEIDGTASFRYREDNTDGVKENNNITKIIVNAKMPLSSNFDVYARLGVEGLSNKSVGKDFIKDETFDGGIDQYGFIYKNAGVNYKVGRQELFLGTGILYDNTGNIGKHQFLDGVTATAKSGVTSLQVVALQEDNLTGRDNKIYGIHATYNPAENLTLGTTLAQYKDIENTNFWMVNASYVAGKATYSADFGGSDANTENKAYSLGVSYAPDAKNTLWVTNYNIEENANINNMTAYEPNAKGFYYGADHKFTKDTALHLFYRDKTSVSGDRTDNTSFRATVSYNF